MPYHTLAPTADNKGRTLHIGMSLRKVKLTALPVDLALAGKTSSTISVPGCVCIVAEIELNLSELPDGLVSTDPRG